MSQNKKILIFEHPHNLAEYFFKRWTEIAIPITNQGKIFTAAFSGGQSPVESYCKLAGLKDFHFWKNCHLFLTDERVVPLDHEDSNFYSIQTNLINDIDIPRENVHFVDTSLESPAAMAEAYEQDLIHFFNLKQAEFPRFDLIYLGIGADGHVASLFPESIVLKDQESIVVSVRKQDLSHPRISLSLPVINQAKEIFFVIIGQEKAEIVRSLFEREGDFPASLIAPVEGNLTYLLDQKAASLLEDEYSFINEGEAIVINL